MRPFEYRLPRQNTSLRVDLVLQDRTLRGTCSDMSEDGLRASFDDSLEVGLTGRLTLHSRCQANLSVRVSRVERDHVALSFSIVNTEDAAQLQRALALILQESRT